MLSRSTASPPLHPRRVHSSGRTTAAPCSIGREETNLFAWQFAIQQHLAVKASVNDYRWQVDPPVRRFGPPFCAAIAPKCAQLEPPLIYVNAAFCARQTSARNKAR
jgi:hypothetical protein